MFINNPEVKWLAHILKSTPIVLVMSTLRDIFNYGIIFELVDTFQSTHTLKI